MSIYSSKMTVLFTYNIQYIATKETFFYKIGIYLEIQIT